MANWMVSEKYSELPWLAKGASAEAVINEATATGPTAGSCWNRIQRKPARFTQRRLASSYLSLLYGVARRRVFHVGNIRLAERN